MSKNLPSILNVSLNYMNEEYICEINNIIWNEFNFSGKIDDIYINGTYINGNITVTGKYLENSYKATGKVIS